MKEVIEFDPTSKSQVLSMMEAFPEAMGYMFRELFKLAKFKNVTPFYKDPEKYYEIKLTEGFIVPEA